MAAAAAAAAASLTSSFLFSTKSNPNPRIPHSAPKISCNLRTPLQRQLRCSAGQVTATQAAEREETLVGEGGGGGDEIRRKLFVLNLPWDFSAPDMQKLFGECGAVKDVEIIKQKNGKSRGFAFVTMSSGAEARAVAEKFNSYELMGRVITVEFAKNFKKPSPPPAPGVSAAEGSHKIYVSNLAWKARSIDVRNFFLAKFKPVSVRVVFDSPTGRSAGYGFVGFATREEAEAAISEFDGKELMGRPLRLRISEKRGDESRDELGSSEPPPEGT